MTGRSGQTRKWPSWPDGLGNGSKHFVGRQRSPATSPQLGLPERDFLHSQWSESAATAQNRSRRDCTVLGADYANAAIIAFPHPIPHTMATTTSIPRFLLPQSSALWRGLVRTANPPRTGTSAGRVTLRFASSTSSKTGKPAQRVLEKPERFNPPSHGARLPRRNELPRHYGGDLTKEEVLAQIKKEYPGLMAPGGTLAYRIIYSKWIHLTITMVCCSCYFPLHIYLPLYSNKSLLMCVCHRVPLPASPSGHGGTTSSATHPTRICSPRAAIFSGTRYRHSVCSSR